MGIHGATLLAQSEEELTEWSPDGEGAKQDNTKPQDDIFEFKPDKTKKKRKFSWSWCSLSKSLSFEDRKESVSDEEVFVKCSSAERKRKNGVCMISRKLRPQSVGDSSSEDGPNSDVSQDNYSSTDELKFSIGEDKINEVNSHCQNETSKHVLQVSVSASMADIFATNSPKRNSVTQYFKVAKDRVRKLSAPERPFSKSPIKQRKGSVFSAVIEKTNDVDSDCETETSTPIASDSMADIFATDNPKKSSFIRCLKASKKRWRKFSAPERPCAPNPVEECIRYVHSAVFSSAGLFVSDCGVNVHENSCKDQIAQCSKFRNTKVSKLLIFCN